MDTDLLRAVVALAEHGTVTRAAEALGLSQPGLSRRLARVEEEVGTPVLARVGAGVELTEAGREVEAYARRTLAAWDDLRRRVAPDDRVAGHLRILASSTPAAYLVPDLLARFARSHPGVRTTVDEDESAAVPARVIEEDWDLGVVGAPPTDPRVDARPVARDEIVLAVPGDHPFAAVDEVDLERLAGQTLLTRRSGSGTLATVEAALAARGVTLPSTAEPVTLASTHAVVSAVARGVGVGFVSRRAVVDRGDTRVVAVRVRGVRIERDLSVVTPVGRRPSNVAAAFLEGLPAPASVQ